MNDKARTQTNSPVHVAHELGLWDLTVANPAFSIWPEALPELLRHALAPGGELMALHRNGLGQRGRRGPAGLHHPPAGRGA